MPELLLTPLAVSHLGVMLPLAFAVVFLCRAERREGCAPAARFLKWGLAFVFGFSACGFLVNSLPTSEALIPLILSTWFLGCALWFMVGFVYRFPELPESQRTEARSAQIVALGLPGIETVIMLDRLLELIGNDRVRWRPGWAHVPLAACFVWLSLVLWRRVARVPWKRSRTAQPHDPAHRAQLTLALLCVLLVGVVALEAVKPAFLTDLSRETVTALGVTVATYILITLGFSHYCTAASLQLRLGALSMMSALALLNAANWFITRLYLEALSSSKGDAGGMRSDYVASRQTFTCTPTADGGYELAKSAPQFPEPTGRQVVNRTHEQHELRLPFTFRYFQEEVDRVVVDKNGWIGFGPRRPDWADFRWQRGSAALLVPALMDLEVGPGPTDGVILDESPDWVRLTWQGNSIRDWPKAKAVRFQVELHRNGVIRLNYASMAPDLNVSLTRTLPIHFVGLLPGLRDRPPAQKAFANGRLDRPFPVGPNGIVHDAQLQLRRQLHPISLRITWLTFAGVIAFGIVFPLTVRRLVLGPLNRLRHAIRVVEAGESAAEIPLGRNDEIGDLTAAFNRMSAAVRGATGALRRHRDDLEHQVALRTADLQNEVEERRRVAEQLALAKVAAEAASQAKSEFLASMSHEIRTPMNGIIGTANLLLETPLTREQRELVEIGRSSSESLLTIVNDILDFSKIEAGQLALERIPVDLRSLLDSVLDTFGPVTGSRLLGLLWWAEPEVPRYLVGDPVRLRQVLVNLVSNGVKFTREGGVDLFLRLQPGTNGSRRLQILVRDTGIGMSPETQQRLFQPFSQADTSTTRKFGGTGLGLVICRQLIELMHGEIRIESAVGAGTTFEVNLPLTPVPNDAGEPLLPPLPTPAPAVRLHSDNPWLFSRLQPLLEPGGQPTAEADCEVVLWDAALPWARREPTGPRRLLLSPMAHRPTPDALRAGGISDVVTLPLKPVALLRALNLLAAEATADPIPAAAASPAPPSSPPGELPVRLLVVEDNPVNEKLVRAMLRRLGVPHDFACNAANALRLATQRTYDTLLLDCQLPDQPGWEVCRQLRAGTGASKSARIIAFSAGLTPDERELCRQSGVDDFLAKPLQLSDLRDKLGAVTGR